MDDPYLLLGEVGRCRILSRIGDGGMGAVYKGRHRDLDLDVAIKFLHPHVAKQPGTAERFLREARLAARLNSPGIVRVFDCGEAAGHYFIVMELIEGQSLEAHIAERTALPVARALQITEAVAVALREAAERTGVIHRDIKPANILLTSSGEVKLADLGLAKVIADQAATAYTAAGTAMGTPSYMSPEQFADASGVDHRADIFSLGATLYHMLSGRIPFRGDSFFQILKQVEEAEPDPLPDAVPDPVVALVARMMAKRREDRFQTYGELIEALRSAQQSLAAVDDVEAKPVGTTTATRSGPSTIIRPAKAAGRAPYVAAPTENRVLLVVDVQNDFCPGGALAVPGGD